MKIEDIEAECATLKESNSQLSIEIQNLVSKDRVYEVASNDGLTQDTTNVVNIGSGE